MFLTSHEPSNKWSHLNQERNLHRSSTVYKIKQLKTICGWIVMWETFTGGSIIMDYGLNRSNSFKLKASWWICFLQTHSFCLLQMLTDGLEWCGLLVDYCDVFISCLDSHSNGTHSLQSIHWWARDVMLHFSKSDDEILIYILDDLRVSKFSCHGWTIPLRSALWCMSLQKHGILGAFLKFAVFS